MAIKINGKLRGETAEEQLQMEKNNFSNRKNRIRKKSSKIKLGQAYLFLKLKKPVK